MRICLVTDSYPCTWPHGGIAVYTQTAARALAARGHEVHVLVRRRPGVADYFEKDFEDGPVAVHYRKVTWLPVVGRLLPTLGEAVGVAKALRVLHAQVQFDIVEFPNFEGLGLVAQLRKTPPIVVRLHTSMRESLEAQQRKPLPGERFMMWMERMSVRMAAAVVTHSTPHRDRLREVYGLREIALIPHGVPIPPTVTLQREEPLVLSVGRLTARKGGSVLLEAIGRVLAAEPAARFVLAGPDATHPLARRFLAQHPAIGADQVRFAGFVTADELEALYRRAQVYVSASVYESFGLPFVEAMARGLPVVGCATSAMTEIIEPGGTGLLVPPRDAEALAAAVLELLRDATLRMRLAARARQVAMEKYADTRMAEQMEAWYRHVLGRA